METGYFNSVIRLILISKLTFQIKDVDDDGVLIINFYSQTGDGWHAMSTSHTILESDVSKRIPNPESMMKSHTRITYIFKDLQ